MPIEIGGIKLTKIHKLHTLEQADFVRHRIPGLDGDIAQDMGRHSVRLLIEGIYYGKNAEEELEELREAYRSRKPVDFLADIVGGAYFAQVVIERLEVMEQAQEPDQFSYGLTVVEYVEPPAPLALDLSLVDDSLLDEVGSFVDALELPGLLSLPEFSNPLSPLENMADDMEKAMNPISQNQAIFQEPNIFNQLDESLTNSALDQQLGQQGQAFSSISQAASNLSAAPPGEIMGLAEQINNQPLPQPQLSSAYTETLDSMQQQTSEGTAGITAPLSEGIDQLQGQIQSDISGAFEPVKSAYTSMDSLLSLLDTGGSDNVQSRSVLARNAPLGSQGGLGVVDQIQAIVSVLDRFEGPMNVERFLEALHDILSKLPRDLLELPRIPFIDELTQVLETTLNWRNATGAQIGTQLEQTLQNSASFIGQEMDKVFQPAVGRIQQLNAQVDIVSLNSQLQGMRNEIPALIQAIRTGEVAEVTNTLATLTALQNSAGLLLNEVQRNFAEGKIGELGNRLDALPVDVENRLHLITSILAPSSDLTSLGEKVEEYLGRLADEQILSQMAEPLLNIAGELSQKFEQLNISVVQEPIATAAEGARQLVDNLEGAMAQVVAQFSLLFDEIEKLLDTVDTQAVMEQMLRSIKLFQERLQQLANQAFGPIRGVLEEAIEGIAQASADFQPDDIVAVLQDALQSLTGLLNNASTQEALDQIKDVLGEVKDAIESISFRTVNDLAIAQINEAKTKLQNIDTSELNGALKSALKTALKVLPDEAALDPIREALVEKADFLITEGPIKAVRTIEQQPARLASALERYAPQNLLGDSLSAPFQQLVGELDAFSPLSLFGVVDQSLEQLRRQLQEQANPAQLIEAIEGPFDSFMTSFEAFQPAAVIAPVQSAIDTAVEAILSILPLDEFFQLVDSVLNGIQSVLDSIGAFQQMLEKVTAMLDGFSDPEAQVDAWVAQILNKLDAVGPGIDFSTAFAALEEAIRQTKADALGSRLLPGLAALIGQLEQLQPQQQLNELILLQQQLKQEPIDALPADTQATIQAFLNSFKPLSTTFNGPLQQLQQLSASLSGKPEALQEWLGRWDQDFHHPDAPINQVIPGSTDVAGIKQLLATAINETIKAPLTQLFRFVPQINELIRNLLAPAQALFENLEEQVGVLINGPDSLGAIRDELKGLEDVIRGINLDFLEEELGEVFDQLTEKLAVFSPATLKGPVEDAFNEILENISLDVLLPQDDIESLNQSYQAVIDTLRQLDPEKLVIEVVQPEYEATIQPYLESFDLAEIFEALISKLEQLKTELNEELDRTQTEFSQMLRAVPL